MKRAIAIVLFVVMGIAAGASAEVPKLLSYQGVLTDAGGVAVPNGPYNITFRIYDVPSGGSAIWLETDPVQVNKGIFNATLGTVAALTSLKFDVTYYLSISVGGGAELPRQTLAAVPYSLNSQAVVGTSNVFPASGNVGVGTTTPTAPLHVQTSDIRGIRLDGTAAGAWSLLRINAAGVNSSPGIELCTQDASKTTMYVGTGDDWHLQMTGADGIVVNGSTRNVGLGVATPLERLDVVGGIRLGTTVGAHAGTLRWTGVDFEGYDGATWKSLTATGAGSLPSGTSGQTLRHDGVNWVATSNLYNSGANIGIGTTLPASQLHLEANGGVEEILVNQMSSTGSVDLRLKTNGGPYDHLMLQKYAPSAGGSVAGIPLANLAIIDAGISGGAMMHRVASNNPIYFLTNNLERMRLTGDGKLGINVAAPTATLHVGGGVNIGTTSTDGELNVFQSGITNPVVTAFGNSSGGFLTAYDEGGEITSSIEPDQNGTGGFLAVERGVGTLGFTVDGNYIGTGDTRVIIEGATKYADFNMNLAGDASVELPTNAISSREILDEPGIANYATTVGAALTASFAPYASQTINAPAAGYVLVMATADVGPSHTNGIATNIIVSVSASPTSVPATQNTWLYLPAAMPTSLYHYPVTVSGMFPVAAGSNTFYLDAEVTNGVGSIYERNLSIIYIPTAYGSFIAPLTAVSGAGAKDAPIGGALTASDIAATTRASEAADAERVQKELDAMKDRVAKLEAEMRNSQVKK